MSESLPNTVLYEYLQYLQDPYIPIKSEFIYLLLQIR